MISETKTSYESDHAWDGTLGNCCEVNSTNIPKIDCS